MTSNAGYNKEGVFDENLFRSVFKREFLDRLHCVKFNSLSKDSLDSIASKEIAHMENNVTKKVGKRVSIRLSENCRASIINKNVSSARQIKTVIISKIGVKIAKILKLLRKTTKISSKVIIDVDIDSGGNIISKLAEPNRTL